MPKGSKLKELWADPEWRAQRLKDLRENRKWIEIRSRGIGGEEMRKAIVKVRRRRAIRKNYDLERENATLWWLLNNKFRPPVRREDAPQEPEIRPSGPVHLAAGPYIRRIEELEENMSSIKDALGTDRELLALRLMGLTEVQARLAGTLYRREMMTKDGGMAAIYIENPDKRSERDPRGVDVHICSIRKKLTRYGIEINTIWGEGYRMPAESKAKLKSLMDRQFLKQAAE